MTPELQQEYIDKYEDLAKFAVDNNLGDIFSFARSKEVLVTCILGHTVANDYSGADAFNKDGQPVEYKSTIAKNPKGAYTGISVLSNWKDQETYLREEKIGKYSEHYYNRFSRETGVLEESWKMAGELVLFLLLPKLERKFPTQLTKKDPRLSANITWTNIKQFGVQVYSRND